MSFIFIFGLTIFYNSFLPYKKGSFDALRHQRKKGKGKEKGEGKGKKRIIF
jgi:hypothetical protein